MAAAASSTSASAPPPQAELQGLAMWGAGVLLAIANFLAVLDMSIANVSVPNIAGGLAASTDQGTWVITSYSVAEAIVVPLTGWLARRFGPVRVFSTAMVMFGICSALCGMAQSLGMLVFFRILQGFSGGPLMPLSQTLLMRIFPPKMRPIAMTIWSLTTLTAPILGPLLGGVLCDNFGWPSIFWVNVPIALFFGPMIWRILKRYESAVVRAVIDGVGFALLVLWVAPLQLLLDLGKDRDWFNSPLIVGFALAAVIFFITFVIWELYTDSPIVNIKIFRHLGYSSAMVTLAFTMGAFYAVNVLTPLWLQTNMGYTATWSGRVSGFIGALAMVASPIASILTPKMDPRKLICIGTGWLALITFMRSGATPDMTYSQIAIWLFLAGAGMPLFFMPLMTVAMGSVKPNEIADAAGLMSFIRTLAGAVGMSIVSTVWENNTRMNHNGFVDGLKGAEDMLQKMINTGMSPDQARSMLENLVQGQSVMLATNQMFVACACAFLFASCAVWLTPRPKQMVGAPEGAH